jgi:hypothetical protein
MLSFAVFCVMANSSSIPAKDTDKPRIWQLNYSLIIKIPRRQPFDRP